MKKGQITQMKDYIFYVLSRYINTRNKKTEYNFVKLIPRPERIKNVQNWFPSNINVFPSMIEVWIDVKNPQTVIDGNVFSWQ